MKNLEVLVVQPLLLAIYPGTLRIYSFIGATTLFCIYRENRKLYNLEIVPEIPTYWSLLAQGCAPLIVPLTHLLWKNMMSDVFLIKYTKSQTCEIKFVLEELHRLLESKVAVGQTNLLCYEGGGGAFAVLSSKLSSKSLSR